MSPLQMAQNSALCSDCRNGEARSARAQQAPFVRTLADTDSITVVLIF